MPTYVYRPHDLGANANGMVPKQNAAPRRGVHVWRDIAEYRSPIDGRLITSRSARCEDLKRNHCVEVDPRPGDRRGYRNPRFALRRGLPLKEH